MTCMHQCRDEYTMPTTDQPINANQRRRRILTWTFPARCKWRQSMHCKYSLGRQLFCPRLQYIICIHRVWYGRLCPCTQNVDIYNIYQWQCTACWDSVMYTYDWQCDHQVVTHDQTQTAVEVSAYWVITVSVSNTISFLKFSVNNSEVLGQSSFHFDFEKTKTFSSLSIWSENNRSGPKKILFNGTREQNQCLFNLIIAEVCPHPPLPAPSPPP